MKSVFSKRYPIAAFGAALLGGPLVFAGVQSEIEGLSRDRWLIDKTRDRWAIDAIQKGLAEESIQEGREIGIEEIVRGVISLGAREITIKEFLQGNREVKAMLRPLNRIHELSVDKISLPGNEKRYRFLGVEKDVEGQLIVNSNWEDGYLSYSLFFQLDDQTGASWEVEGETYQEATLQIYFEHDEEGELVRVSLRTLYDTGTRRLGVGDDRGQLIGTWVQCYVQQREVYPWGIWMKDGVPHFATIPAEEGPGEARLGWEDFEEMKDLDAKIMELLQVLR